MNYRLLPGAQADLEDAAASYEARRPGLGGEFALEAFRTFEIIAENPLAWRCIYKQTRRGLLRRFPYSVVYDIDEDLVIIVAVIHQHRHPGAWREKLRRAR